MHRLTMVLNPLLMFLFWIASFIAIFPVHNNLIVYGLDSSVSLPSPTATALSLRWIMLFCPWHGPLGVLWSFKELKVRLLKNATKLPLPFLCSQWLWVLHCLLSICLQAYCRFFCLDHQFKRGLIQSTFSILQMESRSTNASLPLRHFLGLIYFTKQN